MRFGTKAIATVAMTGGIATVGIVGTTGTANASGCPTGGCGTIDNITGTHIAVCLDWVGKGQGDNHYQYTSKRNYCRKVAYIKPHTTWGWPQGTDIDAFYIARGTRYYGGISCWLHPDHPYATWTHSRSGWWKFSGDCEEDITSKRG